MGDQVVKVECYSGSAYAERPTALVIGRQRIAVKRCLQSARTPQGKAFTILLNNDLIVKLDYCEKDDRWNATGLPDSFSISVQ